MELENEASGDTAQNDQTDRAPACLSTSGAPPHERSRRREWRVFLTAKFDRKVGAARFRELMAELTSTIDNIDSDQGGAAEFSELLGPELFATYQAELVETLEKGSDPGAFWAKWIDVVVERMPPETTSLRRHLE